MTSTKRIIHTRIATNPDPPLSTQAPNSPPDSRAEFIAEFERVARIWKERGDTEAAAWTKFKAVLASTQDFEEALEAYSDFSWQRMQAMSDDVRRLFEEFRTMTG